MRPYAISPSTRLYFLLVLGVPPSAQQRQILQTVSVLLSVTFVFLIGLSFLLMLCSDLLTLVKDESDRDLLCGVFNRRGIEQKLDPQLNRPAPPGQTPPTPPPSIDNSTPTNHRPAH